MYLSKLKIKNFRAIEDLEIEFKEGVTILVGENNAGKTTIIDALRAIMIPAGGYGAYRLSADDFTDCNTSSDIEVTAYMRGLSEKDEIALLNTLAYDGDDDIWVQLNLSGVYDAGKNRIKTHFSCGHETASNTLRGMMDYVDVTYLRPLRDPSSSLAEGRRSCQAMHITRELEKKQEAKSAFLEAAKKVNETMASIPDIAGIVEKCNEEIMSIVGKEVRQKISLVFNNPDFIQLISGIKTLINGKSYFYNGLGYNNVIEIAMILAARNYTEDGYYLLLIEEPEAHLHPMLQRLLLTYIQKIVATNKGKLQVIITTHSPTFASKADIANICHVSRVGGKVACAGFSDVIDENAKDDDVLKINNKRKSKLQRYLDVTRGEIFFTKRVILVEGVAELILLPIIAKINGYDLDQNSVTVINCLGLNFEMFVPVLERLGIRTAIVTDDDEGLYKKDKNGNYKLTTRSPYSSNLENNTKNLKSVQSFFTHGTFELALFKSKCLRDLVLKALSNLGHSTIASGCSELNQQELYKSLFVDGSSIKKGELAQELAILLENEKLNVDESIKEASDENVLKAIHERDAELKEAMPLNVIEAIKYVCGNE